MGKNWLIPIGLVIFFSVAIPVLFLENEKTLAAGFIANNPAKHIEAKPTATPREILTALNQSNNGLTKSQVDHLLFRLLQAQSSAKKHYESILFSESMNSKINRYSLDDLVALQIKDSEVKSLVRRILDDGFRLSSSEGMIYIECNYPKLLTQYGRRATLKVRRYLAIMAEETQRHFAEDAALTITPDILAERLWQLESFLNHYPHFERVSDLTTLDGRYLSAYLLGLNNTPTFQYATNRIDKDFLMSYRQMAKRHPENKLTRLIRSYLNVLEKNHYLKTPEILDFIRNINTERR